MKMIGVLSTLFITFCLLQSSCLAVQNKKVYIVHLGGHGNDELYDASKIKDSHFDVLDSVLGSKEKAKQALIYSYKNQNAFAVILDEEAAAQMAGHPNVVSVTPDGVRSLHTTRSWTFLNLDVNGRIDRTSLWSQANFGEDIIIANLDTGVWPESESFNGDSYDPVPARWKGGCDNQTSCPCNKKLIGTRYFNLGYEAAYGMKLDPSMNNARDHDGHGSHTLSTAAGNFVGDVSINDIKLGTAKGGSPRARVAAYKVCWPQTALGGECADSDIVQGFEAAIEDGVDVLSVSLGGTAVDYKDDPLAIASFHAFKKGISVVFSAGNSGPGPETVSNVSPWAITVGASTIDREFQSLVHLAGGIILKGLSMSKAMPHENYPLIDAAKAKAENATVANATLCKEGTLDPKKVKGKILVCLRGENGRTEKSAAAAKAGAIGMILCNDKSTGNELIADPHVIPSTHIAYAQAVHLYDYLNTTQKPSGYLSPPLAIVNVKPAPSMAVFSSRGPNPITPQILKPDITAPGVNIIAAYTQDKDPVLKFNIESGTSMACPHVSGVVGLLKKLHPDWSPSAIKSAIMTTAEVKDNEGQQMTDETKTTANPFSRGSGDINPNGAMDPGLVYNLTETDYLDFLCTQGYNSSMRRKFSNQHYDCPDNLSIHAFNYPSITVSKIRDYVAISRTLTNVGDPGVYLPFVRHPPGFKVDVIPKRLHFKRKGHELMFAMTITPDGSGKTKDYVFGELNWSDGKHSVRSPIVASVA